MLQRQARHLLSAQARNADDKERPVAFALFSQDIGVLPDVMDCRHLVLFDKDERDDPMLILAATEDKVAVYLAVNLREKAAVEALESAVANRTIEFVLSGPGGGTSHELVMSSAETKSLRSFDGRILGPATGP